jgi:hypothetical protein
MTVYEMKLLLRQNRLQFYLIQLLRQKKRCGKLYYVADLVLFI